MDLPSPLDAAAALVFTPARAAGGLILLTAAIAVAVAAAWHACRRDACLVAQARRLDAQIVGGAVLLRSSGDTAHQLLVIAEAIETALDPVLIRRLGAQLMAIGRLTSDPSNPLRIEVSAGPGRIRVAYPSGRVALFPALS